MFALRCGGPLLYEGCGTRRFHPRSPGSAKTRVVIDAIVSTKTFRNATLREKSFRQSFSPARKWMRQTFRMIQLFCKKFPKRTLCGHKAEFMQNISALRFHLFLRMLS